VVCFTVAPLAFTVVSEVTELGKPPLRRPTALRMFRCPFQRRTLSSGKAHKFRVFKQSHTLIICPLPSSSGVMNKQRSGVTGAESRRADRKLVLLWRRVGVTPLMTERVTQEPPRGDGDLGTAPSANAVLLLYFREGSARCTFAKIFARSERGSLLSVKKEDRKEG
ncbi:hypothetical protein KUCAC02_001343, partial [Chaenocephalus aceratus]